MRRGENSYVIARMPSGWAVIGDVQPLPGYCLPLADPPLESINALGEPVLHTLIVPRIANEPDDKRRMPACMSYDWATARRSEPDGMDKDFLAAMRDALR